MSAFTFFNLYKWYQIVHGMTRNANRIVDTSWIISMRLLQRVGELKFAKTGYIFWKYFEKHLGNI